MHASIKLSNPRPCRVLAAVASEAICSLGRRPAFRPTQTRPFIPPLLDRYRDGSRSNGCGWKTQTCSATPWRACGGHRVAVWRTSPVLVSEMRPGCSLKTRFSPFS